MGWMTEQVQGFVMNHSLSKHAYPTHPEKCPHYSVRYIAHLDGRKAALVVGAHGTHDHVPTSDCMYIWKEDKGGGSVSWRRQEGDAECWTSK